MLSLLIVAGSFAIRQSKTILARCTQPTEWQRIGNQIDAAFIFARADFVNVIVDCIGDATFNHKAPRVVTRAGIVDDMLAENATSADQMRL